MSSNASEYFALLDALDALERHHLTNKDIIIYTDSQVLARQMSGEWKAVKGFYLEYYLKAKSVKEKFPNIKFQWIPREENEEADALTREVYENWCRHNGRKPKYGAHKG